MPYRIHPAILWAALVVLLAALALARPLDHDESQYVAAAMLSAYGALPYRDYLYLQTPLQPLLFAPLALLFGGLAWPGLRIVNALLGAGAVMGAYAGMRAARVPTAIAAASAALFACCDILLFSIGTARNDALPLALFAAALPLMVRGSRGEATPLSALLAGLLLAGAAAAKVSYAVPALAYGIVALVDRRHRPLLVAAGAGPVVVLIGWLYAVAPAGFAFGVLTFPARAPAEYYLAAGKAWKLGGLAKMGDTLKFLALGPALPALLWVLRDRRRDRTRVLLDALIVAGLVAALLPAPTWRQYLAPVLPPLFARLALAWQARPPGKPARIIALVFAVAGLAPSVEAGVSALHATPMLTALRQSVAIRAALDGSGSRGPVVTLSPQFLAGTGHMPDARFAAGPFYFRSRRLLDPAQEPALHAVSRDRLGALGDPPAILVGGEGAWTSGDAGLDAMLANWARSRGYRAVAVPGGRFTLYIRPR
ncbi:DUF2029 domain-containing protein [Sphingomonas immobilis]|uniref:DUF2029 domain-containing protein n=1 Tax=Sphingomonas immobilis TaxID=3063997 RepID=A0ABT9A373_9SPHN|nr:DUF2029 domain-containing protein [Sphingomonas sp. CA1-15]MDO7843993.1 DUF2029 domain-containing protein [Sphingomonas sp. CA1-15]